MEEATDTPSNKYYAVFCSLASVDPVFLFRSLAGLGGEGSSDMSWDLGGSGGSWSFASSVHVRGTGGPPVVSSSPPSPLLAGLGDEGMGEQVNKLTGSSEFFTKRGRRYLCCAAAAPVHLAGLGGEGVALGLPRLAWACDGPLWEPLEFRLSPAFHPRRRCLATVTRGHKDGHAELGAQDCASLILFVRSSCLASPASKSPV